MLLPIAWIILQGIVLIILAIINKLSPKGKLQATERMILYGIISILIFSPLPFGSDRPAPLAIITIFIGMLSIYWGILAAKDRRFVRISLQKVKWLVLAIFIVLTWALIQIIPLDIAGVTSPFWNPAKHLLPGEDIKASVSINIYDSSWAFFKIVSYTLMFWLVLQISRRTKNANIILHAISWSGAAYAAYGLFVYIIGIKKVLWYDKIDYLESLTSTFINRNNYATYAGIVLIISAGLFLNSLFKDITHLKTSEFYKILVQRLFTTSLPSAILVFIISSSLLLTGSRAGIVCSVFAVIIFVFLLNFTSQMKQCRKTYATLSMVIAATVLLVFCAGGNLVIARLHELDGDIIYRSAIYGITLNAIKDFAYQGTGLGSFTDIFNAYRDASVAGLSNTLTDHAHNAYIELMLELGIPAATMFILVMVVIWLKCFSGVFNRKKNAHIPAIAVCSTLLIATHSLFDFSAQIPAITIIYIALLAVGLAQSWSVKIDLSDASDEIKPPRIYYEISTKLVVLLGIILYVAGLWQIYTFYVVEDDAHKLRDYAYSEIDLAVNKGVLSHDGTDLLAKAEHHLAQSIKLAPVDAYSWTYLSYATLLSSDEKKDSAKLMAVSIENGKYQTGLVFFRLKLLPILWTYATEDEKNLFASQIKLAWKLDKKRTMQIMNSPLALRLLEDKVQPGNQD